MCLESYILISFLNDFIFCPRSIYFHQLFGNKSHILYQSTDQISGKCAHSSVDNKKYSTRKDILQGVSIYSEKYKLHGKIDIFDINKAQLTERKKTIKQIYDGYIFQLYGQYYCLTEMGYSVKKLRLYSMSTNKIFPVKLPSEDIEMKQKFEKLIYKITNYNLNHPFVANKNKCQRCIYSNFCDEAAVV